MTDHYYYLTVQTPSNVFGCWIRPDLSNILPTPLSQLGGNTLSQSDSNHTFWKAYVKTKHPDRDMRKCVFTLTDPEFASKLNSYYVDHPVPKQLVDLFNQLDRETHGTLAHFKVFEHIWEMWHDWNDPEPNKHYDYVSNQLWSNHVCPTSVKRNARLSNDGWEDEWSCVPKTVTGTVETVFVRID